MTTLSKRLYQHVYQLATKIGEHNVYHPEALQAARTYITDEWRSQGYDVVEQEYIVQDVPCANLEIVLPGTDCADECIIIGAHYDSVIGAPGANDNSSGVAAILELSRMMLNTRPECTLRFVAFTNEEAPFFSTEDQGAVRYVRVARQRPEKIRLMICLETIGYFSDRPGSQEYPALFRYFYPDRGNFIALVSNFKSRRSMLKLAKHFRAHSDLPLEHVATFSSIPGVSWSDHSAFWNHGYQAVMVTDTAFYRYPYYHTSEDTPDKVDYDRLARVTEGLYRAIGIMAKEP